MATDKVMTPEFRVSFPHVFTPHTAFDGQPAKYSLVMLIPKNADISALKKLALEAAKEKWGDKIPKDLRNPFRDGDTKELEGYKGCWFIQATTKTKPGLVDNKLTPIIAPEEFYAGCYARATVNAYAYDRAGNKGVAFGLQNIQKLKDGEPFSGRTRAEDDFDATPDAAGAENAKENAAALFE